MYEKMENTMEKETLIMSSESQHNEENCLSIGEWISKYGILENDLYHDFFKLAACKQILETVIDEEDEKELFTGRQPETILFQEFTSKENGEDVSLELDSFFKSLPDKKANAIVLIVGDVSFAQVTEVYDYIMTKTSIDYIYSENQYEDEVLQNKCSIMLITMQQVE